MNKLRTKMLLLILLPTLLFFAGMTVYVSYAVHAMVKKDAEKILDSHGYTLAGDLRVDLENALRSAETISQSFQGFIENESVRSRDNANTMLQKVLQSSAQYHGAWMYWNANAFDGSDINYIGVEGNDATGRFIPSWTRTDTGFKVEPLTMSGEFQERVNRVLQTGDRMILDPYWYETAEGNKLFTSIISPVTIDGKTIGMIGIDILLDDLHRKISRFQFYESGFAALLTNNGTVVAHRTNSLVNTDYFESEGMKEHESVGSVRAAVRVGRDAKIEGYSAALEKDVYRVFSPIQIGSIKTTWSAMVSVPIEEVTVEAKNLTTTIITSIIVVLVILNVIILLVTLSILRPIRIAVGHGQEMAAGDFSRVVPDKYMKRKDEIGDLVRIFATISDSMSLLIARIQDSTRRVVESADSVDEGTRQSSAAANEVATSIEQVARSAEMQKQNADESAGSMEDMAKGVQSVSSAASTLLDAANEMTGRANFGQEAFQNAAHQMGKIQQDTESTKAIIEHLQVDANKIEGIVAIITGISEQTDLLALNAAIEAARAGDAGRGFAVVASEVRKLADETKDSAASIQQLVKVIRSSTLQATESINAHDGEVLKGKERIVEVGAAFGQILGSIQHVVDEIGELSAVAEEMSAGTEEIAATSEEIAASAETAFSHTQQVAAAVEQQLASMDEMTRMSDSLKGLAGELSELLQRFKLKEIVAAAAEDDERVISLTEDGADEGGVQVEPHGGVKNAKKRKKDAKDAKAGKVSKAGKNAKKD